MTRSIAADEETRLSDKAKEILRGERKSTYAGNRDYWDTKT